MKKGKTKYIFVCGGVLSGLGKGITTASIGLLLKNAGFTVTALKIDPYISIDAGTMRPQEHGEVFVTVDGGEIDMDLGNYERFLDEDFTKDHNITTGKVYAQVIDNERKFVYQGRDAEIIPDIINEIKRRVYAVSGDKDFVMIEIGGTVGDIENMPFLIAAREIGREYKSAYIMVSYLPFLHTVGELKTKPTQHAAMQLRHEGINPDFLVTRAVERVDEPRLENLSNRCFIDRNRIFDIPDVKNVYEVPLVLEKQSFVNELISFFRIKPVDTKNELLEKWHKFVSYNQEDDLQVVKIALVGKYVKHGSHVHNDSYISVLEALRHAGFASSAKVDIAMLASEDLNEENYTDVLNDFNGIVVPQGWGSRGMEGKLFAIRYARENNVPYLGLCYGMQMAVIEYARNVLGLKKANSEEVDPQTPDPVIHLMEEQKRFMQDKLFGGTIRLGNWPCVIKKDTRSFDVYKNESNPKGAELEIFERHRHRYEFNNDYRKRLEDAGLVIAGTSPDSQLVEMIELSKHKFFIGTQGHPEYRSRPLRPHPLFVEFIKAGK